MDRTYRNRMAGVAVGCILLSSALSIAAADEESTGLPLGVPELVGYHSWTPLIKGLQVDPMVASRCIHPPFEGHPGTEQAPLFVSIYANEQAKRKVTGDGKEDFAAGSIIVKEKLKSSDQQSADNLGVMIKRQAGFDSANGDWEFLYISGSRVARGPAELKNCYSCHAGASKTPANKSDYVFIDRYLKHAR